MRPAASVKNYTQYAFGPDDRYHHKGRYWTYLDKAPDGIVIASEPDGLERQTIPLSHARISELVRAGEFECDADHYSARNSIIRSAQEAVADLPPIVMFRARMISEFLAAEEDVWDLGEECTRSDESIQRFMDRFVLANRNAIPPAKGKRKAIVSPRHFRRLVRAYEAMGLHPAALVPKHRGRVAETPTYTTEELQFHQKFALKYQSKDRPTKKDCWDQMHEANDRRREKGLPEYRLPALRTFQRIVADLGDYSNEWTRSGDPDRVARKFAIARKGLRVDRPLQIVQMDEHKINVVRLLVRNGIWDFLHPEVKAKLEDKKRVWLSVAIDVYSRSILGAKLLFGAPNAAAAVATLAMVARPKDLEAQSAGTLCEWPQCGTPDEITTDAGSSYVSNEFQNAVFMFTGKHSVPASKHPYLRAVMERFFRSLNQRYIHLLSGQTFENVLLKDQYDSAAHAHITDEQLADLLVRLIVDCYHNTKHRGLWGATPLQAWYIGSQVGKGTVKIAPTKARYGEIFGIVMRRKISNYGITILGVRYSSLELQALRDRWFHAELDVKLNDRDLGSIFVKHWSQNKWMEVPAVFEDVKGMRLLEWLRFVIMMKKRFGTQAKHTQEFVRQQLAMTRELAEESRRDAGILAPTPTEKEVKRYERATVNGFKFDQTRETDRGDEPAARGRRKKKASPFGPPVTDADEATAAALAAEARETSDTVLDANSPAPRSSKKARGAKEAAPSLGVPTAQDVAEPRKRTPLRIEKIPRKD